MTQTLHDIAMDAVMRPPFDAAQTESFYLAGREAKNAAIPKHLRHGGVGKWISKNKNFRNGMWNHQAIALNHLFHWQNVVVTTSTGSGKTEIAKARILYLFDTFPRATAVGFFPAKALQTDQIGKLQKAFRAAGYKSKDIGIINGDEKDHDTRLKTLRESRFVLMTPDVLHSWVLNNLHEPEVRNYLSNLAACFIDEAHVYDKILGSHGPTLFRRLRFAVDTLKGDAKHPAHDLQFIAASASLKDAPAFMRKLTGCSYTEVGNDQDGSRKFDQDVIHIAAERDEQLATARKFIKAFLSGDTETEGAAICFVDSRRVVEELAAELNASLGKDDAVPYIGGYSSEAREEIQVEIRNGKRRIVFCTSVLEMGVDFEEFCVGISIGKPDKPADMQQRVGRVGRGRKGLFVVIAPEQSFSRGRRPISLEDYCKGGLEIKAYDNHPQVLAINALSLQNEMRALGLPPTAPFHEERYEWGNAFIKTMGQLRKDHPIFDDAAAELLRRRKRNPHLAFGLRTINSEARNYELIAFTTVKDKPVKLATMSSRTTVFECYPGAIFQHRLQKYQVIEWSKEGPPQVLLRKVQTGDKTHPFREKVVFADDSRKAKPLKGAKSLISVDKGLMVECHMDILDGVIGYARYHPSSGKDGANSKAVYYNTAETPKDKRVTCQTHARTTGVVIDWPNNLFDAEEQKKLGLLIRDIYCDIHYLSRKDVDMAVGKVFVRVSDDPSEKMLHLENGLVIYDGNAVGLRFTSDLFKLMPDIIKIMPEYPSGAVFAERVKSFYEGLTERTLPKLREAPIVAGETKEDVLGVHTKVLWKDTSAQIGGRNGKGGEPEGVLMQIKGSKKIAGELVYQIEPYDDPTKPRKRTLGTTKAFNHYVPRISLTVVELN